MNIIQQIKEVNSFKDALSSIDNKYLITLHEYNMNISVSVHNYEDDDTVLLYNIDDNKIIVDKGCPPEITKKIKQVLSKYKGAEKLDNITHLHSKNDPNYLLKQALNAYKDVLLIGYDTNDILDVRSSKNLRVPDVVHLLEVFKLQLLNGNFIGE